jgi:polyhydroxybutyrate depolymerase
VCLAAGVATASVGPVSGNNTRVHVGEGRSFVLHTPIARVNPPAAPDTALIVLHGWRNTWHQVASQTGFSALADQRGFLVAYPEGYEKSWNAGVCCGEARRRGLDDIGFLTRVIANLKRRGVERIAMVGFSNGGMMAYAFACARPDLVQRVGVMSGSLQVPTCPAPIQVLHIHGLADDVVPFQGTSWSSRLKCWIRDVRSIPRAAPRGRITIVPVKGLKHRWARVADGVDATEEFWRFSAV